MAKKFSLKDNPIFQRLEVPRPQAAAGVAAAENGEMSTPEGRVSTLDATPSEEAPQQPSLPGPIAPAAEAPPGPELAGQPAPEHPPAPQLELKDDLDRSLFFGYYTEVADELFPQLDPAEQVLYNRLFRLSYGFRRNYCTVSQPLLMEGTGLSRNTVRTALQSLMAGGWIKVVEAGKHIATTYRVVLPHERSRGAALKTASNDPLSMPLTESASEHDARKSSLQTTGPGRAKDEGQYLPSQSSTVSYWQTDKPPAPLANPEGQRLPPLSGAFASPAARLAGAIHDPQNLTPWSQLLAAKELVEKFYTGLGQRASKGKRERSIQECLGLLHQGLTLEQVDDAIAWFIAQHPTARSFTQLVQCLDQSPKGRQTGRVHRGTQ